MLERAIKIDNLIKKGKVLIIYGARQVGKTTLVKDFIENSSFKHRYDIGDNFKIAEELSQCTYQSTDNYVGDYELIVIDEAQKIPHIGNALKLMVDRHPDKYFIATGSSSFELANKTSESLTGRKKTVNLFPISQLELSKTLAPSEMHARLNQYLIYGTYPEVVTTKTNSNKENIISDLTFSYLIKDILEFDRIKNSSQIFKLLKLLAFQVGSEVSISELAKQIGVDTKTVLHYLDLLEKAFVIFPLGGFSRNLRKEISKMSKYYFYDNGIRNSLINNFNSLENRNDIGQLWECFLINERRKRNAYKNYRADSYFWRTYNQSEIDLIEEQGGSLNAFEFKWQKKDLKPPKLWTKTYPNSTFREINGSNYMNFII